MNHPFLWRLVGSPDSRRYDRWRRQLVGCHVLQNELHLYDAEETNLVGGLNFDLSNAVGCGEAVDRADDIPGRGIPPNASEDVSGVLLTLVAVSLVRVLGSEATDRR